MTTLAGNPKAQAYYERGVQRAQQGDIDGAISDFSMVIQGAPAFADAYYRRGALALRKNDRTGATLDFQMALQLLPDHPAATMMRQALAASPAASAAPTVNPFTVHPEEVPAPARTPPALRGHSPNNTQPPVPPAAPPPSAPAFSAPQSPAFSVPAPSPRAIEPDPHPSSPSRPSSQMTATELLKRGVQRFDQDLTDGAITDFNAAIKLDPYLVEAYANLGAVYHAIGELSKARDVFEKALSLDPNYPHAETMRKIISEAAAAESPNSVEQFVARAMGHAQDKDFRRAQEDLDQALKMNPKSFDVHFSRGRLSFMREDYRNAIAEYDKAVRLDANNAQIYIERGKAYMSKGDPRKAIADFTQTLKIDPNSAEAYCRRGTAKREIKDARGAIADFTDAIRLDPQYADAYAGRGNLRLANKDVQGALDDASKALDIQPNHGEGLTLMLAVNAKLNAKKR